MTKWVENKEVVFTCQRDIFEYLLDENNGVYHVKDNAKKINHFEHGYFGWYSLDKHTDWIPMKRAEWYDDIPEKGVLCWVDYKQVALIYLYKDEWFYTNDENMHKTVTPLTKEEVMQYILHE